MTDTADQLVSDYLDGALSPAERARVESDADLSGRLEQFRLVQDLVKDTPPLPSQLRERLVGNAVAASTTAPNVTSLTTRRTRRTRLALVGAAAAAVVVLGGIIALNNDGSDSDLTSAQDSVESVEAEVADDATDDAAAAEALDAPEAAEEAMDDDAAAAGAADEMSDADAADQAVLVAATVTDRAELESILTADVRAIGAITPNALGAFDPGAAATILACTEELTPELNGAIDGLARAVITDTSGYLGVPADTEVLIIIAGDTYAVVEEATCSVFATESLFS